MGAPVRTVCHCEHDVDTHFERSGACLASRCDCPHYRDALRADTFSRPFKRPSHPAFCQCYGCRNGVV